MRVWPTCTLLPGLTLRRVITPSISADDCAVAQIKLRLVEIALSLFQICLGLLQGRRVLHNLRDKSCRYRLADPGGRILR